MYFGMFGNLKWVLKLKIDDQVESTYIYVHICTYVGKEGKKIPTTTVISFTVLHCPCTCLSLVD